MIDLLTTFGEFILSGVSRVLTFCQQLSFTKFTLGIWDKWEVVLYLTILIAIGILFEQRKMTIKKGVLSILAILALLIECRITGDRTRDGGRLGKETPSFF